MVVGSVELVPIVDAVGAPHVTRTILPFEFEELGGETRIGPGVTAFPLPGHYPGHMGVRIESNGERALLIADAAVHPAVWDVPDLLYVSDLNPARSAATRHALLDEVVDGDVLVACGHYPEGGIGRVRRPDHRVVWEAA